MSKKKKTPTKQEKKPRTPARFAADVKVRVKPGTTDPDYPNIPLGGRAGMVREVDQRSAPPTYLIQWNRHTLAHMDPVTGGHQLAAWRRDLEAVKRATYPNAQPHGEEPTSCRAGTADLYMQRMLDGSVAAVDQQLRRGRAVLGFDAEGHSVDTAVAKQRQSQVESLVSGSGGEDRDAGRNSRTGRR